MDFKSLYEENKNLIIILGMILIVVILALSFSGFDAEKDNSKKVSNIIFSETEVSIEENRTYQVKYDIYPSNLEDVNLTWSSNNEQIATVDGNGLITAVRPGTTVVVAKAQSGAVTSLIIVVNEEEKDSTNMKFNIENFDLKINTYRRLYPIFEPENVNYDSIEWTSSNENIATVSATGVVTGVKVGKAVITATVKLKNGIYLSTSSNVNVTKETTLSVTNSSATSLYENTTSEIVLALSDKNVVVKSATYESSNENIVQVIRRPIADNENSTVTSIIEGKGKGKATIKYSVETTDGELIYLTVNVTVK